jgi:hypothetical protein
MARSPIAPTLLVLLAAHARASLALSYDADGFVLGRATNWDNDYTQGEVAGADAAPRKIQ